MIPVGRFQSHRLKLIDELKYELRMGRTFCIGSNAFPQHQGPATVDHVSKVAKRFYQLTSAVKYVNCVHKIKRLVINRPCLTRPVKIEQLKS